MAAIGRVLLMPKGNYSGSAIYNSLDWVRDNGAAWVCKVDGTQGIAPPTLPTTYNTNWQLIAADGSVSGTIDWTNVNNKPFASVDSSDFDVDGSNELNIKRGTFGKVRVVSGGSTVDLAASGDSIIELEAGSNVTLTPDNTTNPKKITINSTGGGGGSYTASKGVKITTSGDIQADLKDATVGSIAAATRGSTASREYPVGLDSNSNLSVNVPWTDTTYSSLPAASAGADVSLCTTGEKYTWNNKASSSDLDSFIATGNVVNGVITFSGIDDTVNSGNCGYDVYIKVTSSSTNKSPYAKLNTISGEGTSSMTLTYDTDADNGTGTAYLRRIK